MKIFLKIIPLILYFSINNLFLYKYGIRQNLINIYALLILHNSLTIFIVFFLRKIQIKDSYLKIIFWCIVVSFFCFTIILNIKVDGNNLNVDRWSAINVSINALLENNYPYTALDHLNQGSSNLPSLFLIGLPFYLLGNIGYIQSFSFLLYTFLIFKSSETYKIRLIGILLLTTSIFYLWEIYVKSDLMSNFIFILGFILLTPKNKFKRPIKLGILTSFLLFTRIVAIIPLSIMLFKSFIKTTNKKRILFIFSCFLYIFILAIFVFSKSPNLETALEYNPFNLQNKSSQLPLIISVLTILIPLYFSLKVKDNLDIIKYSFLFLAIPIFISFGIVFYNNGFVDIIYNSLFDISYFNIITPFIIYLVILEIDSNDKLVNYTSNLK